MLNEGWWTKGDVYSGQTTVVLPPSCTS